MDQPSQTQPEPEPLQRAIEALHLGLQSDDERRRIDAATGFVIYCLAQEIGALIYMLVPQAQREETDGRLRGNEG